MISNVNITVNTEGSKPHPEISVQSPPEHDSKKEDEQHSDVPLTPTNSLLDLTNSASNVVYASNIHVSPPVAKLDNETVIQPVPSLPHEYQPPEQFVDNVSLRQQHNVV